MYHTIIIECQTDSNNPNCEDCIVYKTCNLKKKLRMQEEKEQVNYTTLQMQCP